MNAQTEDTGETAASVAACGGFTEVLKALVEAGANLELGSNTPLMEAAQVNCGRQSVMFIASAYGPPPFI